MLDVYVPRAAGKGREIYKFNGMIFVQIASYRDPQLIPTLNSLVANAVSPEELVICIAWQHGPEENIYDKLPEASYKIIDIDYKDSKGVCWARKKLQQLYSGEDYILMLDSHHRFVAGWDAILKSMHQHLGSKSIITTYLPSYNAVTEERVDCPWRIVFDKKTDQGVVSTIPDYMFNALSPEPAKFFSAHFAFAAGSFITDIPYDDELYFLGEETSIAIRAFTHGYDMYHPHAVIAWHEYTRQGRRKHWDDHPEWWKQDQKSVEKYLKMHGLGSARTLKDYENFSRIKIF